MIGANDLKRDEVLAINEHRNQTPERLNVLVETLCASVRDECPEDWILSERLEEKESLMMEGMGVSIPERLALNLVFL